MSYENNMRPVSRYRNLPVKRKLVLIIIATVGAALILALGANLVFADFVLRSAIMADLRIVAEVVGSNSAAPLALNDAPAAAEVLSGAAGEAAHHHGGAVHQRRASLRTVPARSRLAETSSGVSSSRNLGGE